MPLALNVDWEIELGRVDDRQKPWLQDGVNERLACGRDGRLFGGG